MGGAAQVPETLPIDISRYPRLDAKQAGHLRHFHNLVSQRDGEWRLFETHEWHQEFDDASRYQLATMAYAAGAAHYHRLPALRGPFKTLIRRMIHKMLRREVWSYWFTTSHSGNKFDPDLKELRRPWADPVVKENIMYSGHLLLMTSLYAMLFDDDEFEREGGLTFRWNPLFWGMGAEEFRYSNGSLQTVILQQMEDNDWVGVCCEPNAVFVVCNQFPIIAMRYNDVRNETNVVDEILPKYEAALKKKGMFGADGLYATFFAVKQRKAVPARQGAHTAWANAFMNSWNPDQARRSYDEQTLGFLTNFGGKTRLHPTRVAMAFRKLVSEEGRDPQDPGTLVKAQDPTNHVPVSPFPFETLNWGCFTMMLSELGKRKELDDLLEYADTHLNPTWEDGGLYYPRNDTLADSEWNLTHVEPHSGNSGIGYSRLNVPDGQRKMWLEPWTKEVLAARPFVYGISFADGVDFLRGVWDESDKAMVLTLKRWEGEAKASEIQVCNLPKGQWATYVGGSLRQLDTLSEIGSVAVHAIVGAEDLDVIVMASP